MTRTLRRLLHLPPVLGRSDWRGKRGRTEITPLRRRKKKKCSTGESLFFLSSSLLASGRRGENLGKTTAFREKEEKKGGHRRPKGPTFCLLFHLPRRIEQERGGREGSGNTTLKKRKGKGKKKDRRWGLNFFLVSTTTNK